MWPHNLHIYTDCAPHMEKVFSIVRQRYGLVRKRKWKTSMWTQPCGAVRHSSNCSSSWYRLYGEFATYQESIPGIIETVFFKWPRSWSLTKQKLLGLQRLIGGSSCGERRLCWLTELFSLQQQKPTSFLTQCYVWEVTVLNQSKHGKVRLNGFRKHITSKNWIASTGNRWNSSGQFSQDSQHWEFSTKFNRPWLLN